MSYYATPYLSRDQAVVLASKERHILIAQKLVDLLFLKLQNMGRKK